MFDLVKHQLIKIRNTSPVILNITNHVTMNFVANGLLSIGASPIMTLAEEEIEDLLQIAHGVVINIGTLNAPFMNLTHKVCLAANRLNKPLILDPVGVGASQYRTRMGLDLLERYKFSIIRGNASEIMALAGVEQNTKGVDSTKTTLYAIPSARILTSIQPAVIVVSGRVDAVVSAEEVQFCDRGSVLMPQITGSGCLLTAVISAFDAIHNDSFEASWAAVNFYAICGELAAKNAAGPGSFVIAFLDALSKEQQRVNYEI